MEHPEVINVWVKGQNFTDGVRLEVINMLAPRRVVGIRQIVVVDTLDDEHDWMGDTLYMDGEWYRRWIDKGGRIVPNPDYDGWVVTKVRELHRQDGWLVEVECEGGE